MSDVTRLPVRAEPLPNNPAEEFVLDCVDGLPAARQKRLILRARNPRLALLDDAAATRLIDALGLSEA